MRAQIKYGLKGGFSPKQLKTIHDQALMVLEKVGVAVDHDGILKYLDAVEGVTVRGRRVHYAAELVERYIAMIRLENGDYTFVRPGETDWTLRPAYLCLNCYDPIAGAIHRATTEDLRKAAKLCDFYGMSGTAPVHPQDVPDHLRQINTLRTCLENSRAVGRWMVVTNEQEARLVTEMCRVAARPPPHVMLQITISPLRLNTEYLDMIYRNRGARDFLEGVTIGGGAIPMLGATGPLSAPAAWVQATAEALAAYITPKLLDPRISGVCSSNMFPFDMRKACMVIGSPEGILARLMSFQINEYLFGYQKGATLGAMGMPLDAQSSAEKMGNILLEALAGTRVFYDVGMTPEDEMFCLEQVVFDREIVQWVKRVVTGMKYDDDPQHLLSAMQTGVEEGSYLMHADTLAAHREFHWEPELFQYQTLATMQADAGHKPLVQRARDIVERDLARHTFELPADARKELARLYARADRELSGK
jgi:trimethylamine:corrinoid methyltransferase-like protein